MGETGVPPPFTLLRFNPVRCFRGAPAAEVKCESEEWQTVLWMSQRDLQLNIELFGPDPELLKAQEYYRRKNVRFPESKS